MYRYDPARGGVYDDSLDDDRPDVPAIAADTSVTPDARPPAFQAGAGGVPGMAAPSVAPVDIAGAAPPAGPGAIQPFKLKESSWSTTTPVATPADAATQAERDAATADEIAAINKQGEIGAQQKELEAGAADQKANFLEQKNQRLGAAVQEFDETEKRNKAELAAAEQEQRSTIRKEGWDTLGTGGKVIASLAIMLNGIARGIVGDRGPDQVLGLVMENIHRKEEAQAAHIAGLSKKIESLKGPAREQAQKILDGKFATNTARTAAELEESAAALDALAARNGAPGVVEKSKEMSAKLRAEAADKRQAALNELREKRTQGGGNKEVIPSASATVPPDTTVLDLSGRPIGRGRSVIESEKLRDQQGKANQLLTALEDLKGHVLEHGRTDIGGVIPLDTQAVRAERANKIKEINGQLSALYAEGVLSEAEFKRSSAGLDTGALKNGEAAAAGIDSIINSVGHAYNAHARAKAVIAPGENPANRAPAAPSAPPPAATKPPAPASATTKTLSNGKTAHKVNGQWVIED